MRKEYSISVNKCSLNSADINRINLEFYQSLLDTEMDEDDRRTIENLLYQTAKALDGHRSLRELANWYRDFAERATNPVIHEARRRTAQDLDAEADAIEQRLSKLADLRILRRPATLDGG